MRTLSSLGVIFILWFAGLCAAAQFAKIGLILPELRQLYPDAGFAIGFLVSLVSIVGALLGLISGVLAARFELRRILLAGLILGAAVSLLQSLILPLSLLLMSRVLEGVSHLCIVVCVPTLIAQHSSVSLRDAAMTLWSTFFGVSFALTAWLGLPLVASQGVDALFFVHGLLIAGAALLVALSLPGNQSTSTDAPLAGISVSPLPLFRHHQRTWTSPDMAAPAAGWLFYTLTFVALLAVLPDLLPPSLRAVMAMALPLTSMATAMTLGIALLRRYTAVQVVCIGFLGAAGFALLMLVLPEEPLVYLLLFAALGLIQGASFAAIPQLNVAKADQALANGAMAQAGNMGNLCGIPLLVMLLDVGGNRAVIAALAGCYVAGLAVHALYARRRQVAARPVG